MDIALHYFDEYLGDALYSRVALPAALPSASKPFLLPLAHLGRDHILRQCISLYSLTMVGIILLYTSVATLSYYFIFDHRMKLHPRYLPNQVRKEIIFSFQAFPLLDLLTLPWFLGDVRGHSFLYDTIEEGPWGKKGGVWPWLYMAVASAAFLFFTDLAIYWIHRWLHIPFFYKRLHKPHHKWIIPTPFASHAFHPVDGYLQSVPYHMMCYMIPLHKYLFIGLFAFVNLWSIFIHDSDMLSNTGFEHYINGPAHHTLHHIYFTCNYGQYFVWADKTGGSFRLPAAEDDPLLAVIEVENRRKLERTAEAEAEAQALLLAASSSMPLLSPPDSLTSSSASSDAGESSEGEVIELLSLQEVMPHRRTRRSTVVADDE